MRHLVGVWARTTAGNPRAAVPPATAAALKSPRREVTLGAPALASVVMRFSLARERARSERSDGRGRADYRLRGPACQGTGEAFALTRRGRPASIPPGRRSASHRSEEHTSELQSLRHLVCRLLLEKKKQMKHHHDSCVT